MPTTNAGAVLLATLMEADAPYYLGVGNSSTAFAASQTDLIGTSVRKVASASRTSNTVTYSCTFSTSEGNFEWLECGLFDAASSGTMLSRKVISLGTKTSSEEWTVNLEAIVTAA